MHANTCTLTEVLIFDLNFTLKFANEMQLLDLIYNVGFNPLLNTFLQHFYSLFTISTYVSIYTLSLIKISQELTICFKFLTNKFKLIK